MADREKVAGQFAESHRLLQSIMEVWRKEGFVDALEDQFRALCAGLKSMEEEDRQEVYELMWTFVTQKMIARGYDSKEVRHIAGLFIKNLKKCISGEIVVSLKEILDAAEHQYGRGVKLLYESVQSEKSGHRGSVIGIARMFISTSLIVSDFSVAMGAAANGVVALDALLITVYGGILPFLDSIKELDGRS